MTPLPTLPAAQAVLRCKDAPISAGGLMADAICRTVAWLRSAGTGHNTEMLAADWLENRERTLWFRKKH